MRVVLDSNFLLDLVRFRISLEEIENLISKPQLVTFSCVVKELKRISRLRSKSAINAKIALKIIELKGIEVLKTREKNADKAIISSANKNTVVATNDRKLRKKLKSKGIKTIYLRAKKHLAIS